MASRIAPTGREVTFASDELIVSKTDLKGRIIYCNSVFQRVSGYTEAELIGQPHSIVRHPGTPRALFQLLWETIGAGREIFAYINNLAKSGDHYWVLAHVTPSFDAGGRVIGYHSTRRLPRGDAIARVVPLYAELCATEQADASRKLGQQRAHQQLNDMLKSKGVDYDRFALSL